MVPTATHEDPFTQYLLGLSLVIFIVGSVGGLAQYLHWSELPSLAYTATILVPAIGLLALAGLYERFLSYRLRGARGEDGTAPDETPAKPTAIAEEPLDADETTETNALDAETGDETEPEDVIEPSTEKN